MVMDTSAWTIFKRFLIGWGITGIFLVIYSCIKYKEFIATAFADYTWSWINAAMPVVIIVFGILYMLKSLFR